MTKTRPVPFSELRTFLERLEFVEKRAPNARAFKHPEEGWLLFRLYGDDEAVEMHDLLSTRRFLDMRGVIEADDFDAALVRANTPA